MTTILHNTKVIRERPSHIGPTQVHENEVYEKQSKKDSHSKRSWKRRNG